MPARIARSVALAALAALPAAVPAAAPAQPAPVTQRQPAAGEPAAARAALVARLDSLATAFVGDGRAAGVTVGVVRGRDTLLLRGYGWADTSARRRAGAGTVYRVGSITKQFTAAAVLQLVEQGRVSLDDPLSRWLPQYPQWGRVTVRQLLNHTSGIPSYTSSAAWRPRMAEALAPDAVMAFVARDSFDFAVGSRFRYNNSGYFLLGQLLERATGMPYAAVVEQRFFRPLGMRTASYCPDAPRDPAFAAGYDRRGDRYVTTAPISMSSPYAAGALCMAVPDYLRWQAALTGGRVVRPETVRAHEPLRTTSDGKPTKLRLGTRARPGRRARGRHARRRDQRGSAPSSCGCRPIRCRVTRVRQHARQRRGRLAHNLRRGGGRAAAGRRGA
jgi:CubicO group peptidase (beta-lactamase class C family)